MNDKLLIKIARFIRDNYKHGEQIPSERLMVKMFHVSRPMIRERLFALAELGYIRVEHGKGMFYNKEIGL